MVYFQNIALFLLLSLSSAAHAERLHPILGSVDGISPEYLERLQPYVDQAVETAQSIGVNQFHIERTVFLERIQSILNGPYYSRDRAVLAIDSSAELPSLPEHFAIFLHEFGHVVHLQYRFNRSGLATMEEFLEFHPTTMTRAFSEFFSDLFAALIANDPDIMPKALRTLRSYRVMGGLTRLFSSQSLKVRSASSVLGNFDVPLFPEIHDWFARSRRVVWNDVYVRRYHRDRERVPLILMAMLEASLRMAALPERESLNHADYDRIFPEQLNSTLDRLERITPPID